MHLPKRLVSRPSSIKDVNSSLDASSYPKHADNQARVPDDHHITYFRPTFEPEIQRSHGGALIANLGVASDEFVEELRRITDDIDSLFSSYKDDASVMPPPILLASDARRLSDLFAPNDPKITPLYGLLLWIVDARSSPLWLRKPEPLLATIRRGGEYRINEGLITQFVMLVISPSQSGEANGAVCKGEARNIEPQSQTLELANLLTEVGVSVMVVPEDGNFFIEVCRPGISIGSLRWVPILKDSIIREEAGAARDARASCFVVRAPRLRRLTLDAIEKPSEKTRYQLLDELLSREIAMLVIVDREGQTRTRTWPKIGKALPVYPDLSSLYQTAEDLGIPQDSLAYCCFSPDDLFAWVDKISIDRIALNVFKDRSSPRYWLFTKYEIGELARGRIPYKRVP